MSHVDIEEKPVAHSGYPVRLAAQQPDRKTQFFILQGCIYSSCPVKITARWKDSLGFTCMGVMGVRVHSVTFLWVT